MEQHADDHAAPQRVPEPEQTGTVHEIRPIENLKVCPSCLVANASTDTFCTACGTPLTEAAPAEEAATEIRDAWPAEPEHTAIQPPLPAPPPATAHPRRSRLLTAALVVCAAGFVAFAVLWQMQRSHAHTLARSLAATKVSLASTRASLHATQTKLQSASALSEKRRVVLLQAKDVLSKVDPLLSSVDTIQNKAGAVGDQGSTLSGDAETFIGTVADLVNYMLNTNAAYYDYGYINQAIDNANAELDTIRADEAGLSGDSSAYGTASNGFSNKASAFTQSVRTLQKQLNGVAGG